MKKNLKFMLLGLLATVSMGAFAATENGTGANTVFTFDWKDEGGTAQTATITGFVTDGEVAAVEIPATVSFPKTEGAAPTTFKVTKIAEKAFYKETGITSLSFAASSNLVEIEGEAFSGCTKLATADFTNATKLTTIGENAFAKTVITVLNLEATKLEVVNNLFDSKFGGSAVVCPLQTLKLPNTWTSIEDNAFINSVNMTTLSLGTTKPATGTQIIGANAFEGAKITELDLSKTTVAAIPATILVGTNVTANETLTTVILNNTITTLNAAFKGFTALSSIDIQNDAVLTTLSESEFKGCTALTSIDLTKVNTLAGNCFAGSGLTSVSFHKNIAVIPASAFWECEKLTTVTFAADYATFNGIEEYAFAYTAIAAITIPKVLTDADGAIANYAFQGCASLKDFTYAPTTVPTNTPVNVNAFKRCSEVIFHTTQAYATAKTPAPTNTTYDFDVPSDGVKFSSLDPNPVTEYKSQSGKYYIKWIHATKGIKVKKTDAKVYDGYLDETDKTLNMIQYKAKGGYYVIPANKAALILTDNPDSEYEETAEAGTSWLSLAGAPATALNINNAATTRATLEAAEVDDELQLFVWSNSATKGTGFGRYTGSSIPAGTLYVFAKPDETNAAAPKINWFDEDGFAIESPVDGMVTGIESVNASENKVNGESYNVAGQKVGANYKGLVIKNGKKYIIK